MGVPELLGIAGFMLAAGTALGKVSSSTSAKQAGIEARVTSLEKSFDAFQIGIHTHLGKQDEKLDQILQHWYELSIIVRENRGSK